MYEVTMPKLSDSMEVGQIIQWKVRPGDKVCAGDVLAEVETDKATMELECFSEGVISEIIQGDGSEVPVGGVIARIATEDEAPAQKQKPEPETPPEKAPEPEQEFDAEKPPAPPEPERKVEAERPPEPPESKRKVKAKQPVEPPAQTKPEDGSVKKAPSEDERVAASPYARKLAAEHGIDYAHVTGSGPQGRIIARDVEAAAQGPSPTDKPLPEPAETPTVKPSPDEELPPVDAGDDEAEIEDAPFRLKTQARRVTASKHVIPHFYMTQTIDVTALLRSKDEIKDNYGATVTHVIMLGVIKALRMHPEVNRSYDRGRIINWKGINLGLAVAAEQGLTVAVLRNAHRLSVKELVEQTKELVIRARKGKLSPQERSHATFTISNLGMFGIEEFQPIINPPSSATLAVPAATAAPVVRGGKLDIGQVMKLSLSCDHRILDGVTAARFMRTLQEILEGVEGLLSGG